MQNNSLLTEAQAAEILNITQGTLSVWRCTKRYNIPFVKVGRSVRYSRQVLQDWIDSRTCGKDPKMRFSDHVSHRTHDAQ